MHINSSRWRMAAAVLFGSLALSACDDEVGLIPKPRLPDAAEVSLELSTSRARTGQFVAVGVLVEHVGRHPVGSAQGRLRYDATKLRYAGQSDDESFVLVNDKQAGELRIVAVAPKGLPTRVATFVFEVLGPSYDAGLQYVNEELADTGLELLRGDVSSRLGVSGELAARIPGARRLGVTDWAIRLDGLGSDVGRPGDVSLKPGDYRLNLVYGDANLSGGVSGGDALVVAQVAAGLREMIVGSDGPNIDVVVAGNPIPFNCPAACGASDLGLPGDALPPGLNADGSRTLTGADALAIQQEAALLNPAIVGEIIPGRGPIPTNRINVAASDITTNTTWTADNIYELQGIVRVTGNATLTIEPGTRVESVGLQSGGILGALFIARDGMINAVGTPLQPIVFTCAGVEPKPKGCWGGVWIAGNARVNLGDASLPSGGVNPANGSRSTAGCNERAGEATTPQLLYGGCNDTDNSGSLRYARIEYAGWVFQTNVELNGLTLGAVGSGTTIDHIQVHAGLDDAVEFFGGTVNLSHLYLTANQDDNIDISFGYRGNIQFVVIQQDNRTNEGDAGIEADNSEGTGATFTETPRTTPQIWNVTFVGYKSTAGDVENATAEGIHVRRGTGPFLSNWIVTNAASGMDLDDAATCAAINTAGGVNIRNSTFADVTSLANSRETASGTADPACPPYAAGTTVEADIINDAANSNLVSPSTAADLLVAPTNFRLADFRPRSAALVSGGGMPPAGLDASATYKGAVAPANSTRSNAPWYAGWTRGWFSDTQP